MTRTFSSFEKDGLVAMKGQLQVAYERSNGLEHGTQQLPQLDFAAKIYGIEHLTKPTTK